MIGTKNHVLIIITVAIIGSLLYFYFDPSAYHFFPPCPFYFATGWYCPGCGSQRAFHELLHGNIIKSADHNILFVTFLPFIGFSAAVFAGNLFFGKKISQKIFNSTLFTRMVLIVVLLFWLIRNIQVSPFLWLAP